eukprot:1161670-Pelagomonas_calceolata.AAC.12
MRASSLGIPAAGLNCGACAGEYRQVHSPNLPTGYRKGHQPQPALASSPAAAAAAAFKWHS